MDTFIIIVLILAFISAGITAFFFLRKKKCPGTSGSGFKGRMPAALSGFLAVLCILVFTVGFMAVGGYFIYRGYEENLRYTAQTEGIVIEYAQKSDYTETPSKPVYAPVVRYHTEDGSVYAGTGSIWTQNPPFKIGETVSLRYAPGLASPVYVAGYASPVSWQLGIIFFLFGFVTTAIFLFSFILNRVIDDPEYRRHILGRAAAALIVLLILAGWCILAGPKLTALSAVLFLLYLLVIKFKGKRIR